MYSQAHKTEGVNRTVSNNDITFTFTGHDPRKGWRTPLKKIKYSEQRDEETGYSYFGARYMDHELMTLWLSVDPMADKYPGISPYAYCAWNPVKLVDPDGRDVYITGDKHSKDEALRQIQQKSKNMIFSIDENLSLFGYM